MKIFTKKNFIHKIVLSLVILILTTTVAPNYSYSAAWADAGGALLKEIIQLFASVGDAVMGALNGMMLGTQSFGSAMVKQDDPNMEDGSGSWLKTNSNNAKETVVTIPEGYMDENGLFDIGDYQIPNMLYSPENIFANRIAALDINFLNPNKYTSATTGQTVEYDENSSATEQDKQVSGAAVLRSSIATWYKSFRNIAIVGLLSVLVYLGIRILISTAASDKAKYKENLKDWLLALCLVFVMHIIMSGIIMVTDKFTELFSTATSTIKVEVADGTWFYTNLTGLVRFKAQAEAWQEAVSYTIIYLALIIYTCIFTFIYFKRFLYTAFFTMIAPLVALTYPIDKAGDKRAQAFNLWIKEYTMNIIIQPVHLLLYTALIANAMDLVTNNPLYALVAIAFLVPAEKFIKKMFGIESDSTSGFGSFAGGALAMNALQKLGSGSGKKSSGGGSKEKDSTSKEKVRMQDAGNTGKLDTFEKEESPEELARQQERQRMLDDREAWDQIANDESASDMDREEAREQLNMIDEDMRQRGYSEEDEEDFEQDSDENNIHTVEGTPNEVPDGEPEQVPQDNINGNNDDTFKNKARRVIGGMAPIAGRTIWKATKGTARFAAKATATVGGAAIGVAAGLTTGDFSKTMTYMVGGAVAGKAIGNKVADMPSNIKGKVTGVKDKVVNKIDNINDEYRGNVDGYAAMQEQQIKRNNKRARKAIMKDENEIRKYKQMAADLDYKGNVKDLMNVALDYKEAGIDDDKLIKNALKVEKANGGIGGEKHKNVMDVAKFTKDYGKDYIEDEKKRDSLEKVVQSKISNKASQKEIMETFADIHGRKDFYKKNSKLYNQPARRTQQQTQEQSPRQPRQQPRQQPPRQQPQAQTPRQPRQQPPRQQPQTQQPPRRPNN